MLNPLWLLFSIVVWLKKTTSLPKLYFQIFLRDGIANFGKKSKCLKSQLEVLPSQTEKHKRAKANRIIKFTVLKNDEDEIAFGQSCL